MRFPTPIPKPYDRPGYVWGLHGWRWCWRKATPTKRERIERYAAKMRAGETPFFRRGGSGTWGTGPERRAAAVKAATTATIERVRSFESTEATCEPNRK
jgi:hypothetical protein